MSTHHDAGLPTPGQDTERDPQYGFLIDNSKCIGCHACSTACKSENEVPLGVYRTWVKTTETGLYPDTRRHFQVTRCNHCSNPPCVRICPTQAMFQRTDGIVEFDKDACIGCKACMQACPYDAIHIDPNTGTAAKCHYCAHRTEVGMEPACVVVCPEHAIVAGDLNDPRSEIAQLVAKHPVTVRKPEQGTRPKLFYISGSKVNMVPLETERTPTTFATADVLDLHSNTVADPGPLVIGGTRAEHMAQVGYNAQHKVPWHWPVPAYLVTKGIGSGILGLLSAAWLLGAPFSAPVAIVGTLIGLVMLAVTTGLLVFDLEKPERFLYILTRPNPRSWLARGAIFLIGLSTVAGLWFGAEAGAAMGILPESLATTLRTPLMLLTLPLSVGAAIYTAFLFGQAEGRDLWQSPLLPGHLAIQATMMGGATLLLMDVAMDLPPAMTALGTWSLGAGLVADAFVTLFGELGMRHASHVATEAAHSLSSGPYRNWFWTGGMVIGHALPLLLLAIGGPALGAAAAVASVVGLYCYEHAFVMAPQEVPNS